MTKRRAQLFTLVVLLLSILSAVNFARFNSSAQETKTPSIFAGDPALKDVANYRQWTRVNDVPLPVSISLVGGASLATGGPFIWSLVFPDSGSDVTQIRIFHGTTKIVLASPPDRTRVSRPKRDNTASHENGASSFGVIYVNEVARRSLVDEKKPRFPVGSVIVREKLAHVNDAAPQLLVVMVKRERGFNSKARDWEFLMIDGSVSKVTHREKTGGCRDCHKQQRDSDFVFRTYLSEDVRLRQKWKSCEGNRCSSDTLETRGAFNRQSTSLQ